MRDILSVNIQGASHKRKEKECQDSYKIKELDCGAIVIAVADGHGSERCPYSKSGSSVAVNVWCHVISELCGSYKDDIEGLYKYLEKHGVENVAKQIEALWKERILKLHTKNKRVSPLTIEGNKDKDKIYLKYGTTLLGLLMTDTFVFALQIGDGDIVYINSYEQKHFIQGDQLLGTTTYSLCMKEAWSKAKSKMIRLDESENNTLYLLATDGFSNSYGSEEDFLETCKAYKQMIDEHGTKIVRKHLKLWMNETSENGSGDDITVVMLL